MGIEPFGPAKDETHPKRRTRGIAGPGMALCAATVFLESHKFFRELAAAGSAKVLEVKHVLFLNLTGSQVLFWGQL